MTSLLGQSTTTDGEGEGDLVGRLGTEIQVAVDRWSVGQLGWIDLAAAGIVAAVALLLAAVLRRFVRRAGSHHEGIARSALEVAGQLGTLGIALLAAALVLEILGFSLGPLLIFVLAAIVLILFARPLISNLSYGLLLQTRGMFVTGDVVESNGLLGTVEEVNTRTVVLRTGDGRRAHIPNVDVVDHVLVNYSALGSRRTEISLDLDASADLAEVADDLVAELLGTPYVLPEPAPEVVMAGIDGTRVQVEVLVWHTPELWVERRVRDRAVRTILRTLGGSGIRTADARLLVGPS